MDTDRKVQQLVADGARRAAEMVQGAFEHGAERLDSPIERLLLAQLVHPDSCLEWMCQVEVLVPPSGLIAHAVAPPVRGFYVWPQITIGDYRVDFIVSSTLYGRTGTVIVECDGHDFHEKTRQQAQRDKARDRFLASQGYRVLRYIGSEIYRDPEAVVAEIFTILTESP